MRWILADPQNAEEQRWKQHVAAATDRWWRAFQANASSISASFSGQANFDIVRFMDETLQAIQPDLCWEFGPARRKENVHSGGHRLVITPEGNHWLRPMLGFVLGKAPQIPGWEFYAHRLPESLDDAKAAVEGRVGVKLGQAGVEAKVGRHRKIDLLYTFPQDRWSVDQARNVAFITTETLLGEETLDGWIGSIDVADSREPGHRWLPLERAAATVSAVARSLIDQLPAEPAFATNQEDENWSTYELKPPDDAQEAEDFPLRSDILVGSTCRVEIIEAVVSGTLFDSRCHSRHNERFCYLKIDASEIDIDHRLDHRTQIEDALDPALKQAGAGGLFGGGTGVQYSYIDLSLTNVVKAIPVIRQVLSNLRAPQRTWLLFFDTQFAKEWQGIYPQTPPPPEAPDEE